MCYVRYESRMCIFIFFLQIMILHTRTDDIPIYNIQHVGHIKQYPVVTSLERINKHYCFLNNKWVKCSTVKIYNARNTLTRKIYEKTMAPLRYSNKKRVWNSNMKSLYKESHPVHKRYYVTHYPAFHGRVSTGYPIQMRRPGYPSSMFQIARQEPRLNINNALSMPHVHSLAASGVVTPTPTHSPQTNSSNSVANAPFKFKPTPTKGVSTAPQQILIHKNMSSIDKFAESLDTFDRQFYTITFTKLTTISPADRQENGMSFVQSGFFLLLTLMALSTEVDSITKGEIEQCIGFHDTDMELLGVVRHFLTMLPDSSDKLKLRRSSRLMLWPGREVRPQFRANAASALMLHIDKFNGTESTEQIVSILNHQVEMDSGGAIRDTFDEYDVSGGVIAALITTLYVRSSWRTAPTVLNGSRIFHDHENAPKRTVRMIRINDIMSYADLKEWDAQALEIYYASPGLSLLMLIPRGNSLRSLVQHVNNTSVGDITAKMKKMRVAATVPFFTLRMTLLLPNKLQAMGIPSLVDVSSSKPGSPLRLSHAVQRIMFWAEAGRNAYKDDGIEWDLTPDLEVVADRPYIFFVRWRNLTILNGNFVL